jgi:hypothetical protein
VEELLGPECWSLTVLVYEEVAPLEEEKLLHRTLLCWLVVRGKWLVQEREIEGYSFKSRSEGVVP